MSGRDEVVENIAEILERMEENNREIERIWKAFGIMIMGISTLIVLNAISFIWGLFV